MLGADEVLGVERLGRRTTVSRVRGFYTQDGRVPTRTTDMTRRRRRDTTGSSREKKREKKARPDRIGARAESDDYVIRSIRFSTIRKQSRRREQNTRGSRAKVVKKLLLSHSEILNK